MMRILVVLGVFLLGIAGSANEVHAQTKSWDGGGDGTSWSDPANWNPNGVPTASDEVAIAANPGSAYTVVVAQDRTIARLDLTSRQATLQLDASVTVTGNLFLYGSRVDGAGGLTVEGLLTWQGGTLAGAGTTTASGGLSVTGRPGSSGNTKVLDARRLVLSTGQTADDRAGLLYGRNGGVLEIEPGATYDLTSDANYASFRLASGSTTQPRIENAGTFRKDSGGATVPILWDVQNRGTLEVADASATLSLQAGLEDQDGTYLATAGVLDLSPSASTTPYVFGAGSTLRAASGARLNLSSQNPPSGSAAERALLQIEGTVDIAGTLSVRRLSANTAADVTIASSATLVALGTEALRVGGSRGWLTVETTDPIIVGNLVIGSLGRLTLNSPLTVTGTYQHTNSSARLESDFDVTVQDKLTWRGGTMTGTGSTIADGGLDLVGGPGSNSNTKVLDARRLVLSTGQTADDRAGLLYGRNGGVLEIEPGATYNLTAEANFASFRLANGSSSQPRIENAGTFRKVSGGADVTIRWDLQNMGTVENIDPSTTLSFDTDRVRNDGTLNFGDQTLDLRVVQPLVNTGTLVGTGRIDGTVRNEGIVSPGGAPADIGFLVVDGVFTQTPAGRLILELGGTLPGTEYDRFIASTVELDGTAELVLINGYAIGSSDVLEPVAWQEDQRTGSFASVEGQENEGPFLGVRYTPTDFEVFDGSIPDLTPAPAIIIGVAVPPFYRSGRRVPVSVTILSTGSAGVVSGRARDFQFLPGSPAMPACPTGDAYENLKCRMGRFGYTPPPPGPGEEYPFLDVVGFPAPLGGGGGGGGGGEATPFTGSFGAGGSFEISGSEQCVAAGITPSVEVGSPVTEDNLAGCAYAIAKAVLEFVPGFDCFKLAAGVGDKIGEGLAKGQFDLLAYLGQNMAGAINCAGDAVPATKAIRIMVKLNEYASRAGGVQGAFKECEGTGGETTVATSDGGQTSCLNSYDPNDKFGPPGVGDEHYIADVDSLPYVVFFENLAEATAPAQTVVVSDTVDVSTVDMNTFTFGMIAWGDTSVAMPDSQLAVTKDVDLRPAQDLIVRIEAEANETTGVLTWTFTSLDPSTMQPTTDPTAGFLPPNDTVPEGEGLVSYFVDLVDGLPSGTTFGRAARIVFDDNAPIDTPVWSNTLDLEPPTSVVGDLDATQTNVRFDVQWSGTDAESGIQDYSIYVSENGGDFTPWLTNTTETSATFEGERGATYGFYSVARDRLGFVESPPVTAEAITAVAEDALPVELSAFTAARDGEAVRLTWTTAAEENNAGFHVERAVSVDDRPAASLAWKTLSFVDGAGTTDEPQTYRFADERLPFEARRLTYRLRQVDSDGTVTVTPAVEVDLGTPDRLVLHGNFPNPFRDQTTLRYELPEAATVQLVVYDALGRPVRELVNAQQPSGRKEVQLNASGWSSGLYFVRLIAGDQVRTQRLTVLR